MMVTLTTLLFCAASFGPPPTVNDTCATAEPGGSVGSTTVSFLSRTLEPGETSDYFRVLVPPGYRADIQALFNANDADINLRLWNVDCSALLDESVGAAVPEATDWLNDTGVAVEVTAQVTVQTPPTSTVDYRLRVTGTVELCDFADEFEPNDSCAVAPLAALNQLHYPLTLTPTDHDWIRFSIPPSSSAQFNVLSTSLGQPGDVDLELWSGDCVTLIDSAAVGPVRVSNELDVQADVFLHVFRTDSDPACSVYSIVPSTSIGIRECTSVVNTSGNPASIYGIGSARVVHDALFLDVSTVPTGTVGLYVYGPDGGSIPLGNGQLCVGVNGLVRGPISLAQGFSFQMRVRASAPAGGRPPITPGTTLRFQAWFRDALDPTGFGLSDAIRVTFTP